MRWQSQGVGRLTVALEIERKFLLKNDTWKQQVSRCVRIRQGYLNRAKECSIRVRAAEGRGWLNIKSATIGVQRHEYEYEIPFADAEEMLDNLCMKPLIEKVRHYANFGEHVWEIDVFEGENEGLVVAEIELSEPGERFDLPPWAGKEVTEDPRYYNTCLARHPFKHW